MIEVILMDKKNDDLKELKNIFSNPKSLYLSKKNWSANNNTCNNDFNDY